MKLADGNRLLFTVNHEVWNAPKYEDHSVTITSSHNDKGAWEPHHGWSVTFVDSGHGDLNMEVPGGCGHMFQEIPELFSGFWFTEVADLVTALKDFGAQDITQRIDPDPHRAENLRRDRATRVLQSALYSYLTTYEDLNSVEQEAFRTVQGIVDRRAIGAKS